MKIYNTTQFEKLKINPMSQKQLDNIEIKLYDQNLLHKYLTLYSDSCNLERNEVNELCDDASDDCYLNVVFDKLYDIRKSNISDTAYIAANLDCPTEWEKMKFVDNESYYFTIVLGAVCFNRKLNFKQRDTFANIGIDFNSTDNWDEFYSDQAYDGNNFFWINIDNNASVKRFQNYFNKILKGKNNGFANGNVRSCVELDDTCSLRVYLENISNGPLPIKLIETRNRIKDVLKRAINYFNESVSEEIENILNKYN